MNNDIKVNSASYSFIGLFSYSPNKILNINSNFERSNFYEENKDYFQQKYYNNWLKSVFCDLEVSPSEGVINHFRFKKENALLKTTQLISLKKQNESSSIEYLIRDIDIFLFQDNLGVFVIKIDLPLKHLNWKDIVDFSWEFRKTTINQKYNETPHSVKLIEDHIIKYFHSDLVSWRQFNPNLKTGFYIDIDRQPKNEEFNELLLSIGTFNNPFETKNLYGLNLEYKQSVINNGLICIYDNWKTLCLYDTLTRIAVNLNEEDKYKLWENEYILIYVYVVYSRFYLHNTNMQLANLSSKSKALTKSRNSFIKFINDYSHSKISYKFLPNEIYSQLKQSLDIEEEIASIEEKVNRMNMIRQERNENRLNRILSILTLLTLISVAYDGGQWLGHQEAEQQLAFYISLIIFITVAVTLLFIYLYKRNK